MRESSDILKQLFDRDIVAEGEGWLQLISFWEKIVGLDLAAHIKIKDIQNGTLILESDHPGWAQIFYMKKRAVMTKLRNYGRREFPHLKINNFRVLCGNSNINTQLVQDGKVIEEYQESRRSEGEEEIPQEFSGYLDKLRNLGD